MAFRADLRRCGIDGGARRRRRRQQRLVVFVLSLQIGVRGDTVGGLDRSRGCRSHDQPNRGDQYSTHDSPNPAHQRGAYIATDDDVG
ncbi:MAG: hypothetical protein ACRDK4_12035 [Solirubrobacteraceae bacterium]